MLFLYVEIAVRMCVRLFVLHVCMQNMLSARLQYRAGLCSGRAFVPPFSTVNDISDVPLEVSFPCCICNLSHLCFFTLSQRGEVDFEKAARPDRYDSKLFFWDLLGPFTLCVCGGVCGLADGMA